MTKIWLPFALLAMLVIGAAGCRANTSSTGKSGYGPHPIVVMQTTKGTMVMKLFPEDAPISVDNFVKLVSKGFYDGLMFHRVADLGGGPGQSHIVQGGDPSSKHAKPGDPSLGSGGPGYTIKGEFSDNGVNNPLLHNAGAVAMARENDPDTAGSQFYIVVTPAHDLDGKYAVFGQVIKGLGVAKKIVVGDRIVKATVRPGK